jgi:hypothetical protein
VHSLAILVDAWRGGWGGDNLSLLVAAGVAFQAFILPFSDADGRGLELFCKATPRRESAMMTRFNCVRSG